MNWHQPFSLYWFCYHRNSVLSLLLWGVWFITGAHFFPSLHSVWLGVVGHYYRLHTPSASAVWGIAAFVHQRTRSVWCFPTAIFAVGQHHAFLALRVPHMCLLMALPSSFYGLLLCLVLSFFSGPSICFLLLSWKQPITISSTKRPLRSPLQVAVRWRHCVIIHDHDLTFPADTKWLFSTAHAPAAI